MLASAALAGISVGGAAVAGEATGPEVSVEGPSDPTGALPDAGATGCAYPYERATLAESGWALDATVAAIRLHRHSARVTLDVNRWYRGGTGERVRVTMSSPHRDDAGQHPHPTYGVGTRLLLSGELSRGDVLVWSCGFTRYHDERTAATWSSAFS